MDFEQYLRNRYNELLQSERNAWANLGQIIGAREEVEKLLAQLQNPQGESLQLSPDFQPQPINE